MERSNRITTKIENIEIFLLSNRKKMNDLDFFCSEGDSNAFLGLFSFLNSNWDTPIKTGKE